MKKVLPLILLIIVVIAAYCYIHNSKTETNTLTSEVVSSTTTQQAEESTVQALPANPVVNSDGETAAGDDEEEEDEDEDEEEEEVQPATELYQTAAEAFDAILKGSTTYDDQVFEQFVGIGNCSWCNELYTQLKQAMLDPESSDDQKSYFAEVLAISGEPSNIETIVNAIKEAPDPDSADLYAGALEVTIGDDDTVKYLQTQLDTDNSKLHDSVLAAITNHGSPLAIQTIYDETVKNGDPDGFYSLGIGLGEVVPDEQSIPLLTELANRRDDYSHLAIKALLNSGIDGLRVVIDTLNASTDPEGDKKLLKDAVDHVSLEDETEAYARELIKTSSNPLVLNFANQILEEFEVEEEEEEEGSEEEDSNTKE